MWFVEIGLSWCIVKLSSFGEMGDIGCIGRFLGLMF